MEPSPLTVADWHRLLSDYSSTFLNSDYLRTAEADGRSQYMLSEAQRDAGWLGYEPASEQAVLATEERLGVRLPPSYRNFLLTSNGWNSIDELDLLQVDEIGWFPDLTDILESWSSPDSGYFAEHLDKFERCLMISNDEDGDSSGHWVLHADSAGENGEWTAYEWWPGDGTGPTRHDNFAALMTSAAKAT
ncbi:SMI1/KNR4 family protein [Streptomyces sp. NPDC048462]|uniref:SMI1/KNR4 family protein n=1 Tax=Streptomyces sp. NPDC048462 TaxID=3365555 RepID=UPI00371C301F